MRPRRPTWLLWLAILIALVGGPIAYIFSLQTTDPEAHTNMVLALSGTILGVGVCLVCYTADWWMRH